MEPVAFGILSGLGLAVSAGPVFLTIVQLSIARGFRIALLFIIGVTLADWTMILLSWMGLRGLDLGIDKSILLLIGAIALIIFGITFLREKPRKSHDSQIDSDSKKSHKKGSSFLIRGILMDMLNPVIWIFWAGVSQYSISTYPTRFEQVSYFAGLLITVTSTDILKAYFAQKLRPFFNSLFLSYLNKFIGVLLILLGTKFLYDYFFSIPF